MPGFIEVLHGSKVWFVYKDGVKPDFDPNMTSIEWYSTVVPTLSGTHRPLQCTLQRGDVLYFPSKWYHATLNVNFTVFMTTFV